MTSASRVLVFEGIRAFSTAKVRMKGGELESSWTLGPTGPLGRLQRPWAQTLSVDARFKERPMAATSHKHTRTS